MGLDTEDTDCCTGNSKYCRKTESCMASSTTDEDCGKSVKLVAQLFNSSAAQVALSQASTVR